MGLRSGHSKRFRQQSFCKLPKSGKAEKCAFSEVLLVVGFGSETETKTAMRRVRFQAYNGHIENVIITTALADFQTVFISAISCYCR